jgi:hypothetical protein
MMFDPNAAYPKILFSPDRWLSAQELAAVTDMAKSPEVAALLSGEMLPDGTLVTPTEDAAPVPTPAPVAVPRPAAQKAAPAPIALPDDDEDGEVVIAAPAVVQTPVAPVKAAKVAKVAKAAPVQAMPVATVDDDDVTVSFPTARGETQTATVVAASITTTSDLDPDLQELLSEFGGED